MQLLTEMTCDDFDHFKSAFDADAEKRMNAGLTLMQMWREADAPLTVICLFDVNDRGKARSWLDTEAQTDGRISGRFLQTA